MRLRITHKGLIVVAVSCLIQLAIIGALASLMASTEAEHDLAVKRRSFALKAARLVFANCHAGSKILSAWETSKYIAGAKLPPWVSMKTTSQARLEVSDLNRYIERLINEMDNEPEDDPVLRKLKHRCRNVELAVMKVHNDIENLVNEGVVPQNLYRSFHLRKEIWTSVEQVTTVIWELVDVIDGHQRASEAFMQKLKHYELFVLAGGLMVNVGATAILLLLFDRDIIKRVATVQTNIGLIEKDDEELLPVAGNDEIAQLNCAFTDMSDEIRSARHKEQALFENTADVICILDEEGFIERVNQASEKFWGYAPEQLVDGWVGQLFPADQLDTISEKLSLARESMSALNFECEVIAFDGSARESLWSVIWSDRQRNWYCVVRDIGAEKQIEEEKRRFLSLIVSDLQKPLHRISDWFDNLTGRQGDLPEKLSQRLNNTQRTVARLKGLIDSLVELNLSASIGLKEEKKFDSSLVSQLVADSLRDVSEIALARNITIESECPSEVSWCVDQPELVRVLVNLLANAIKFSDEGARVQVRVRQSGDTVYVEVEDCGRGIPESELGRLFRPFRQTQIKDGARGMGSGLGLFAVKQLVEGQGGRIGVSSEEGKGSKFWFSLPTAAASADPVDGPRRVATTLGATLDDSDKRNLSPFSLSSDKVPIAGVTGSRRRIEVVPQRKTSSSQLKNKVWILILMPVLFQLMFAVLMMFQILHERSLFERESKERIVITDSIQNTLGLLRTGIRLDRYYAGAMNDSDCRKGLTAELGRLKKFKRVLEQDELASQSEDIMTTLSSSRKALQGALSAVGDESQAPLMFSYSREISARAHELSFELEKLLDRYEVEGAGVKSSDSFHRQGILLSMAVAAATLLSLLVAVRFSRDVANRLGNLADNCHRFSIGLPLGTPMSGTDEIAQLDASFRKSARRLMELREKETAFLKNSLSLICTLNSAGNFDSVNAIASRFFNSPGDSILYGNLSSFVPSDERDTITEALAKAKTEGKPVQFKTHVTTSARDLLWSITWAEDEQSFFGIAHDITKQVELERIKREYTAVISHDLRTPLTTILGLCVLGLTGIL
ncbi:MAG: PAS domain S-box protein, partial [Cyanobacteria bacterium]|nr:PAS domain S-box protein [Cyanobacteriota bacterium]